MSKQSSWVVKLECVVEKELICENCTQAEAEQNPFGFAIEERETGQSDWTVKSIEPNE